MLRALLPLAVAGLGNVVCSERTAMAGDLAAAEVLFNDGQKLFDAGKIHEACDKFQESYTQDPAIGTMINLARCHEKEGKTASAWAEYKTVETLASRANQPQRQQYAHDEAAKLEPTLHQLVLNVKFPVDGLDVSRNGTGVGKALWGEKIPVDPGDVVLKATAPGKKAWAQTVRLASGPGIDHFDIPALLDAPVEAPKDAGGQTVVVTSTGFGTGRIVGLIVAGAGIVAAGIGGGVLALAFSEASARDKVPQANVTAQLKLPVCQPKPVNRAECSDAYSQQSHNSAANSDQTIAQALFIGGGALFVSGLVVFFVSGPSETTKKVDKTSLQVIPSWTPTQSGLTVVGTF